MANFSEILAKKTVDQVQKTSSEFVGGVKASLLSKVPSIFITTAKLIDESRKEAAEADKKQTEEIEKQTKQQKKTNQFLGDSNKWLKKLSDDMRVMREKTADKFAEENSLEKKLLDEKMLSTLTDIRDALTGEGRAGRKATGAATPAGGGDGLLDNFLAGAGGAAAGAMVKRYAVVAARAILPFIKRYGLPGLVLGTAATYALGGEEKSKPVPQKSFDTGKLDKSQKEMSDLIYGKFKSAGFSDAQSHAAVVNAFHESRLNPNASNVTEKEASFGLFQMNMKGGLGSSFTKDQLLDPAFNIDLAIQAARKSSSFMSATDISQATSAFTRDVMRPADTERRALERAASAKSVISNLGMQSGPNYLSEKFGDKQRRVLELTDQDRTAQDEIVTLKKNLERENVAYQLAKERKAPQDQLNQRLEGISQLEGEIGIKQHLHKQLRAEILRAAQDATGSSQDRGQEAARLTKAAAESVRQRKLEERRQQAASMLARKRDNALGIYGPSPSLMLTGRRRTGSKVSSLLDLSSLDATEQERQRIEENDRKKRERANAQALKTIQINTKNLVSQAAQTNRLISGGRAIGAFGAGRAPQLTPDQRRQLYFDRRYQGLISSAGNVTRSLISTELNRIFFPRGQRGVTLQQAQQNGFLASVLTSNLNLRGRATGALSDIFGNRIGKAYGGLAGEALGLGLEQFAGGAGRALGFGENGTFRIEQILGNFAGKNKDQRKLAREQLIYNLTGVPTGSTSLIYAAQKFFPELGQYKLIDPKTGRVSFEGVAKAGGDLISGGLSSLFGFPTKAGAARTITKINPETGETYQALAEPGSGMTSAAGGGLFGNIFGSIFGQRQSVSSPGAPRQITQREQSAFLEANIDTPEELVHLQSSVESQSSKKDDQGFFGGVMDSITGLSRSIFSVFTGGAPGGGTGIGGISLGGMGRGAGSTGGGFFDNMLSGFATLGTNLLGMYAGQKIMQGAFKTKNPYTQMIGSLLINEGIKYGLKNVLLPAAANAISGTAAANALVSTFPTLAGTLGITGASIGTTAATAATAANAATIEAVAAAGSTAAGSAAAGSAAAGSTAAGTGMMSQIGAFLTNPATIAAAVFLIIGSQMARGGTHHYSGVSLTKGNTFDRTWLKDIHKVKPEYTQVTDGLARTAKDILTRHATNVKSKSKYEVGIAIGSDGEDPSFYHYQIYKDGALFYNSGQKFELSSVQFPGAVEEFVNKKFNDPLVDAMKDISVTAEQKSAFANVTEYTTAGQMSEFVRGGSKNADVLKATYGGVLAENPSFTQDISSGGTDGSVSSTPMVYSLKDKGYVALQPIQTGEAPIYGTGEEASQIVGTTPVYSFDTSILGYDEAGNPIRSGDLKKRVGSGATATAASSTSSTVSVGTGGTATGVATASSGTPVTDYYNASQQALNNSLDTVATGGGNTTALIAPTNVVDNSVKTNTTIVNTDTRNNDPVLYGGSRRFSFAFEP